MSLVTLNGPKGKGLRRPCEAVTDIRTQVLPHLEEAVHILKREHGIGLAAPQMGVPFRWYIDTHEKVYINPVFVQKEDPRRMLEGCLSIPERWYSTERYGKVALEFTNLENEVEILQFSEYSAYVAQHELDHLDGILISDHGIRKYAGEEVQEPLTSPVELVVE
jgi:peptide deformylase